MLSSAKRRRRLSHCSNPFRHLPTFTHRFLREDRQAVTQRNLRDFLPRRRRRDIEDEIDLNCFQSLFQRRKQLLVPQTELRFDLFPPLLHWVNTSHQSHDVHFLADLNPMLPSSAQADHNASHRSNLLSESRFHRCNISAIAAKRTISGEMR